MSDTYPISPIAHNRLMWALGIVAESVAWIPMNWNKIELHLVGSFLGPLCLTFAWAPLKYGFSRIYPDVSDDDLSAEFNYQKVTKFGMKLVFIALGVSLVQMALVFLLFE